MQRNGHQACCQPDNLQQRDFCSESKDKKDNNSVGPVNGNTLKGDDDPNTVQAIAEGKRFYVSNIPYIAKTKDAEMLFAEGEYHIQHIDMSIEPYTGRNPLYGFVEVATKE